MARPEGFEPPTNGFGSHYSIRLSYGRVVDRRPGNVLGRASRHPEGGVRRAFYLVSPHKSQPTRPQAGRGPNGAEVVC